MDDLRRPFRIDVTGAKTHDSKAFDAFLNRGASPAATAADKAEGSAANRQGIAEEGAVAVIPSQPNERQPAPHDPNLYAMRKLVERFFCRMNDI